MNHLHLYALPDAAWPGPLRVCGKRSVQSLLCSEAELAASCFAFSFDELFERLQQLDRMFIEADGSFVWSGERSGGRWQWDGMVYDSGQHVRRLELKGAGPGDSWRTLLKCLQWPDQRILAHWIDWDCFEELTRDCPLLEDDAPEMKSHA